MSRCLRMFAPMLALAAWAIAAKAGMDPDALRWGGPALTAIGCAVHTSEELRLIRGRRR